MPSGPLIAAIARLVVGVSVIELVAQGAALFSPAPAPPLFDLDQWRSRG